MKLLIIMLVGTLLTFPPQCQAQCDISTLVSCNACPTLSYTFVDGNTSQTDSCTPAAGQIIHYDYGVSGYLQVCRTQLICVQSCTVVGTGSIFDDQQQPVNCTNTVSASWACGSRCPVEQ